MFRELLIIGIHENTRQVVAFASEYQQAKEKMKSKIISITLFLVVAILFASGCSASATPTSPEATATLLAVADTSGTNAEGHVVPREKVYLSFASGGHVEKILVEKGDKVQAGQVLAELDTAPLQQIAVDQAQRHIQELTSAASIAAAEQVIASARDTLDEAQDDADSLYYPRASETLIKNTTRRNRPGEKSAHQGQGHIPVGGPA